MFKESSNVNHVDPCEGRVVDLGIEGSSDVTACFRDGLSQSGLRTVTNMTGRIVEVIYHLAETDAFEI